MIVNWTILTKTTQTSTVKKKLQHTVKLTLISKHSADVEGLGGDEDFNPFDNNNPDPFDKSVKYNVQYGHTKKHNYLYQKQFRFRRRKQL